MWRSSSARCPGHGRRRRGWRSPECENARRLGFVSDDVAFGASARCSAPSSHEGLVARGQGEEVDKVVTVGLRNPRRRSSSASEKSCVATPTSPPLAEGRSAPSYRPSGPRQPRWQLCLLRRYYRAPDWPPFSLGVPTGRVLKAPSEPPRMPCDWPLQGHETESCRSRAVHLIREKRPWQTDCRP